MQGGGAHGAFTWGVLDHILEDGRLDIRGISGASAGAVNAIMVADGLARGGPEEARVGLSKFWKNASLDSGLPGPQRVALDQMLALMPDGASAVMRNLTRFLSPYDFNPLNLNPLRDLIAQHVDFDAIRGYEALELFISATNVHTGEARVFERREVSADVVMASAALPFLFRAVTIDGVPYWDGGYSANPAILPLARAVGSDDVLVIQINPLESAATPNSTREIADRISEITFNASLSTELKAVALVDRLIEAGQLKPSKDLRRLNLHRIVLGDETQLRPASRLNTNYSFLKSLHDAGHRAARHFLQQHFDDIGRRGTMTATRDAA